MRMFVFLFILFMSYNSVMLSGVQLDFVAFPVEFEVGEEGLFDHGCWDGGCSDLGLLEVAYEIPIDFVVGHIDGCSNFLSFFGFDVDIFLFVLFADGAVVAVVADAVHFFEAELLLFVFIGDDSDYDVVVLDVYDFEVEEVLSFFGEAFVVEELVGGAVELLDLVVGDFEFEVVFG